MKKKLHPIVQSLLTEIEAYRLRTGIDKTNFGLRCCNDGNFIARLEHGRMPSIKTLERAYRFIDRRSRAVQPKRTLNAGRLDPRDN